MLLNLKIKIYMVQAIRSIGLLLVFINLLLLLTPTNTLASAGQKENISSPLPNNINYNSKLSKSVDDENDRLLILAISRIMKDDLSGALKAAQDSNVRDYAESIVELLRIFNNPTLISLTSAIGFLQKYTWVPNEVFIPKIERSINHETNPDEIINWFAYKEPSNNRSKFFLVHANIKKGNLNLENKEVKDWLRQFWRSTEFSLSSEEYIITLYKDIFTITDLQKKIDFLIWNNSFTFAAKLINILPAKYQSNLKLKLDVAINPKLAVRYVSRVDEFFSYHYIKNLIKDKGDDAAILKALRSVKPKSNYEKWWKLKNYGFREAFNNKDYKLAYEFTQSHGLSNAGGGGGGGSELAEANWNAGWIALEFTKQTSKAISHFQAMQNTTKLANSKSKASYWLAKAYKKLGNDQQEHKWYHEASVYSATFYGQLAIAKIKGDAKYNYFNSYKDHANKIVAKIDKEKISKITLLSYYLFKANQKMLAYNIINYIPALNLDRLDLEEAASFFSRRNLNPLAVELGKACANRSFILIKEGYPRDIKIVNTNLPKAVYLAIIRQESNFDPIAISVVGARGLMQLMPDTAEKIAKTLGLSKDAYITNPQANVLKGATYVDQLYNQYDSLLLTIAAYNAGPGNVRKWLELIGDPREMKTIDERINWIESVPFAETRNYIKKVFENMVIYNSILDPSHNAKTIHKFLTI